MKSKNDDNYKEFHDFAADQQKLERALSAAQGRVDKGEAHLSKARRTLSEAQSKRLLDDPDADLDGDGSPESRDFLAAVTGLEQAKAERGSFSGRARSRHASLPQRARHDRSGTRGGTSGRLRADLQELYELDIRRPRTRAGKHPNSSTRNNRVYLRQPRRPPGFL